MMPPKHSYFAAVVFLGISFLVYFGFVVFIQKNMPMMVLPDANQATLKMIDGDLILISQPRSKGSIINAKGRHPSDASANLRIGKHQISSEMWNLMIPADANRNHSSGGANQFSLQDCQRFLNQVNLVAGKSKYRLPRQVEWENAVKSGKLFSGRGLETAKSLKEWCLSDTRPDRPGSRNNQDAVLKAYCICSLSGSVSLRANVALPVMSFRVVREENR